MSPKHLTNLAIGAFLVYLAFLAPGNYSIDGNSMLAVAESIALRHDISIAPALGTPGVDGRYYSSWYPLQSILAAPLVALGSAVAGALHLPFERIEAVFALALPALYTALTLPLVALIALRLGSTPSGAWLGAVAYGFGTIAMVYARTFLAEPLLAMLSAASLYVALSSRSRAWTAALTALTGLSVLAKPAGVVLGPVLSAYLLARTKRICPSLPPIVGTCAGLLIYSLYNTWRFGDLLVFGQPFAFSPAYMPTGVVGLLFSTGFGLLWFCPCICLAIAGIWWIPRSHSLEIACILHVLLAFVVLHASWAGWHGGWSWGPRLLLPALPGVLALAAFLQGRARNAFVATAIVGFLLSAPALVTFYDRWFVEAREAGISDAKMKWLPSQSPLLHLWPAAGRQISDALNLDVQELFSQTEGGAGKIAESRALRIVAVWWWVLPIVRIPRVLGTLVAAALASGGIALIMRSRAHLASSVLPPARSDGPTTAPHDEHRSRGCRSRA